MPFGWIGNWEIRLPVGAGGKRRGSWKAKGRTFLSFEEGREKEEEEKGYVVDIDCTSPSGDISPRLCSPVDLVPPPGNRNQHVAQAWPGSCSTVRTTSINAMTYTQSKPDNAIQPSYFCWNYRENGALKIFPPINRRLIDAWSGREFPYREHLHNNVTTNERKKENWVLRIWHGSSPWTQPQIIIDNE